MKAITYQAAQSHNLSLNLAGAISRAKRVINPRNIFRAIFGNTACTVVAAIVCLMMLRDVFVVDDSLSQGAAIARHCALALPWALAWAIRSTFSREGSAK